MNEDSYHSLVQSHCDQVELRMQLTLSYLGGKRTAIDVQGSDTTFQVRIRVSDTLGVPLQQQLLIFRGRRLEDWRTLDSYKIRDGDTIHLVLRLRDPHFHPYIIVQSPSGKTFEVDFFPNDTIEAIKYKIRDEESTPPNHQKLTLLDGTHVRLRTWYGRKKTVEEYELHKGHAIYLQTHISRAERVRVSAHKWTERMVSLFTHLKEPSQSQKRSSKIN